MKTPRQAISVASEASAPVATLLGHMHFKLVNWELRCPTPLVMARVLHFRRAPTTMAEMVPLVHLVDTIRPEIPVEVVITLGMAPRPTNIEPLRSALAPVSRVMIGYEWLQSLTALLADMPMPVFVTTRLLLRGFLNREVIYGLTMKLALGLQLTTRSPLV